MRFYFHEHAEAEFDRAVEYSFSSEINYAMLVKTYGSETEEQKRYRPAKILRLIKVLNDYKQETKTKRNRKRNNNCLKAIYL